jgi:hypothetical protein
VIPNSVANARITRIQASYAAGAPSGNTASVAVVAGPGPHYTLSAPTTHTTFDEPVPGGATAVSWRITCHAGTVACTFPTSAVLELRKARLTVEESGPPAGTDLGGPLLGAGAQAGTRAVRVTVSDAASGVRSVTARLGGVEAGKATLACVPASWSPCPSGTAVDVPVDTTKVADGSHALSLLLEDAAGNQATVQGAGTVAVDNVPPPEATQAPTLSGSAVQGQTLLLHAGRWEGHGRTVALELRWQRSHDGATWVDVTPSGGDAARYVLGAGDVGARLRAVVRASSPEGTTEAVAGATGVVAPAPGAPAPAAGRPGRARPTARRRRRAPEPRASWSSRPWGRGGRRRRAGCRRAELRLGPPRRAHRHQRAGPPAGRARALRRGHADHRDAAGRRRPSRARRPRRGARDPAGGGAARPVATVVTDAAGRFSYRPRTGPSRTLRFAYRAHHGDVSSAITQEVALRVRAAIRLRTDRRALRNRQLVTFRGTVLGTSGRKLVELQVRRGSTWMTFATTFTRQGAFRYRYRFMRTFATARFDFRARVRKDDGFAYETAASARVRVLVRGAR